MVRSNSITFVLMFMLVVLAAGVVSAQEAPVTITFAWWGDPAITKDYDDLIARFEELNPDIRVENLRWGWSGDAREKYAVTVAAGVAPDVFMIPTIIEGALLQLDDLVAQEPQLATQFIPGSLDWNRAFIDEYGILRRGEGPLLGLPMYSLATAIAYNQTMFEQAGIENPIDWTYEPRFRRVVQLSTTNKRKSDPLAAKIGSDEQPIFAEGGHLPGEYFDNPRLAFLQPKRNL